MSCIIFVCDICVLWNVPLVQETVSLNVKGIASRLWPSVEQVALPLYAAKRAKMAVWSANEIASDDCIQLSCCPQGSLFGRNTQIAAKVGPNPLSQFGRKPTQDRVCCAVRVSEVLLTWSHAVKYIVDDIVDYIVYYIVCYIITDILYDIAYDIAYDIDVLYRYRRKRLDIEEKTFDIGYDIPKGRSLPTRYRPDIGSRHPISKKKRSISVYDIPKRRSLPTRYSPDIEFFFDIGVDIDTRYRDIRMLGPEN